MRDLSALHYGRKEKWQISCLAPLKEAIEAEKEEEQERLTFASGQVMSRWRPTSFLTALYSRLTASVLPNPQKEHSYLDRANLFRCHRHEMVKDGTHLKWLRSLWDEAAAFVLNCWGHREQLVHLMWAFRIMAKLKLGQQSDDFLI